MISRIALVQRSSKQPELGMDHESESHLHNDNVAPPGADSLAALLVPHHSSRQFGRYDTSQGGHYGSYCSE